MTIQRKSLMLRIIFVSITLLIASHAKTQTCRIQFIHNSADTSIAAIDLYASGVLIADSLSFRSSSPFITIPTTSEINIAIAPYDSQSELEALQTFPFTFVSGQKYVMVINGELNATGYNPFQPLYFSIYTGAIEAGASGATTDILFCNGASDLPDVDLKETELIQLTAFEDIPNGSINGYQQFLTASYVLELTNATNDITYGSFSAPLDQLGLGGKPVTILTSGFLNQLENSQGASLGLWMSVPLGGPLIELPVLTLNLTARCQIIHNTADAMLDEVDLYINGELASDNFAFRTATPFFDLPAGQDVEIAVAYSNSTDVSQAFYVETINSISGETYSMVLDGILNVDDYNPSPAIQLNIASGMHENVSSGMNMRFLFHHGNTDGYFVNITETEVLNLNVENDLDYGAFSTNFELPILDYVFQITDAISTIEIGSYQAAFATDFPGHVVTIVMSGFQNPEENNNGSAFGLWATTESGGLLFPLELVPPEPEFTQVQLIHNSADLMLSTVDIYLNDELLLNDFSFRQATPYINVEAITPQVFVIAPSTSSSVSDAFFTQQLIFNTGEKYIIVANGIASVTGYNPSPAFGLDVYVGARNASMNAGETDVLFANGCTDVSSVDATEMLTSTQMTNDLPYPGFSDYNNFPGMENYFLHMTNGSGSVSFGDFDLPLNNWNLADQAIVVFLSGFLNPANNSSGEELAPWAAMPDGTTQILPIHVGLVENEQSSALQVYPNPATDFIFVNGILKRPCNLQYAVLNSNGEVVLKRQHVVSGQHYNFVADVSDLASGLYTISISDGTFVLAKRVHIVH